MKLTHDEAYLYIGMELEEAFDPERSKLFIGADTIPGGDIPKKELAGRTLTGGALETLIQLGQEDESQVTIAPSYDFHSRLYGKEGIGCCQERKRRGPRTILWCPEVRFMPGSWPSAC